jgi:hypothetical protein
MVTASQTLFPHTSADMPAAVSHDCVQLLPCPINEIVVSDEYRKGDGACALSNVLAFAMGTVHHWVSRLRTRPDPLKETHSSSLTASSVGKHFNVQNITDSRDSDF